ncbi:MAG: tRNA epoxyqueuosine(34) reductase QueG [Gammaproteobacteria bacterium]|nr:tRNA epoxyqueuosine(34) reductase QueG [Gammaproteobacteria bacterium]MBT8150197.1 tRNA epoxyqueuosine(34) reductase QueG [Gammaproteobacteria bacterium]NND38495.1 tRNA epoxyqueuosine(34) reductase QueG [Pseudomonadales bacterium]NNM11979.1 tRNA epoxyqueuosine(34) reductase QueG [Pseudomonadales bacterium]RZV57971.1 MAG: tRNA epoxyqueuosine(34) reductase QueG [Pseudomonadales bacterium]
MPNAEPQNRTARHLKVTQSATRQRATGAPRVEYSNASIALASQIKRWGLELGFAEVGICPPEPERHAQYLNAWLKQQYHGEMDYMAEREALRADPERLFPGVRSVIAARMDYLPAGVETLTLLDHSETAYIARYALGRDYHKTLRRRLAKLASYIRDYHRPDDSGTMRPFVDSAPVLERGCAERAGLGWIGKNTMLINSRAGSWFFLGELFTQLALPFDAPTEQNHCGSCTACLDICPTKAFSGPFELDARKCISYLTIELKGAIPLQYRKAIGNRIFGCDDCNAVCPWNKFARPTDEQDFQPRHGLDNAALLDLFLWDEATFAKRTEGSPIRRIGYQRWLRNIAVALGNGKRSEKVLDALRARRDHSPLVREHVDWALEELEQASARGLRT